MRWSTDKGIENKNGPTLRTKVVPLQPQTEGWKSLGPATSAYSFRGLFTEKNVTYLHSDPTWCNNTCRIFQVSTIALTSLYGSSLGFLFDYVVLYILISFTSFDHSYSIIRVVWKVAPHSEGSRSQIDKDVNAVMDIVFIKEYWFPWFPPKNIQIIQ